MANSEKLRKRRVKMLLYPHLNTLKSCSTTVALLFVLVSVFGCATKSNSQSDEATSTAPLLVMQKTPCYGPCPAYEATILENGSITFVAWKNLPVQDNDTVQLNLSPKELQQLKTDIAALDVSSLQTVYSSEWTDVPSTYLTFYQDGKEAKRIKHQKGGPEALVNLIKGLDEKLMVLLKQKVKQP